ncbi:hypothetical protein C8A05DRAFT_37811 [Staphylotrichum tortipilum]|uniref:Uncharacterized protein n=1 Tax=Staphylotrichum tortipilum TaxID=2831512 RepID=A0AAN6RQM4_9PEZI|nr:hypothetical protein C8A05DRAFT_37811 [Staphylotrichum longicolle]
MDRLGIPMPPPITRTSPRDTNVAFRHAPRRDPVQLRGLRMPAPTPVAALVAGTGRADEALDRLHAMMVMGPFSSFRGARQLAGDVEDALAGQARRLREIAGLLADEEWREGYLRRMRDAMRPYWIRKIGWVWEEAQETFSKRIKAEMEKWMGLVKALFEGLTWQRNRFARLWGREPHDGGVIEVAKAIAKMDRAMGDFPRI